MKKTLAIVTALLLAATCFADDTPIVQALKIKQGIDSVMAGLVEVQHPAQSFDEAGQKVREINQIGKLLDGTFKGRVVINNNAMPYAEYLLSKLPGSIYLHAPNLTSLRDTAFANAICIDTFDAPECTSLGVSAFDVGSAASYLSPSVRDVFVPKCTSFGNYCFEGAHQLTNVVCSVTSIPYFGFSGCSALENFQSQPLTYVGEYGFSDCSSLKHVDLSPSSCTFVRYCFSGCSSLEITNWPAAVSVSEYAFQNCKLLKNVNELLGRQIDLSTRGMFSGCTGLTELKSDAVVTINSFEIFNNCSSVTNISFPNLTTIANTLRASSTFNGMKALKKIDMPKLKTIQSASIDPTEYLFSNATALEEVEFPELETIGISPNNWYQQVAYLFQSCTSLRRVSMPKLTKLFSRSAFTYCSSLKDVEMPALEHLGRDAEGDSGYRYGQFAECTSLENLSFPSLHTINQQRWTFRNCSSLRTFFAPALTNIYTSGTTKSMNEMFLTCPTLRHVTTGLKASQLLAYPSFANACPYNTSILWHCPADAPFNVDVMYVDNAWRAVTNGTFKLAEYIQGTGTQIINTGYMHKTNTEVVIDFALMPRDGVPPRQYEYMWGANNGNNNNNSFGAYTVLNNSQTFCYVRNSDTARGGSTEATEETRYRMVCCTNQMQMFNSQGELLYTLTSPNAANAGTCPIAIFDANRTTVYGGYAPYGDASFNTNPTVNGPIKNMKLFRFTIKEEGEPVMDLLPGRMGEDGAPCLLDACDNWHPFFNVGTTGQFICGATTNDVPISIGN